MNALWLENNILKNREDLPTPALRHGEALVRVRLAGICSTDLEMVRGYYPFTGVPGHEFVGEVEAVAPGLSGVDDWYGKRVVGEINAWCGNCLSCRRDNHTHCEQRTVLGIKDRDGAFAEYLALPLANLHEVPDSVPDEAAVFVEPLAAALEIQEQVPIRPQMRVLVVGAGRLGQLVAQTLSLTGCDLTVVARHPRQFDLLAERSIRGTDEQEVAPRSADLVVEATGSPGGWDLARQAVRPRGTILLKSTYKGNLMVDFSAIVVDEISLVGSRCGPFAPALRMLENGQVDPTGLIEGRYPLTDGPEAYRQAARPGGLKVLLETRQRDAPTG